jgi:Chromo (CHRromatin Organisation MOdifier) domain
VKGKIGMRKLKQKCYGPFEIIKKIGMVVYELNLPEGSMIHLVFHVSQLKQCRGKVVHTSGTLPLITLSGKLHIKSMAILNRKLVKNKNKVRAEVLINWANLDDEEETWEDYELISEQFPVLKLEDKLHSKGKILSGYERELAQMSRLRVVTPTFEFKKGAKGCVEQMGQGKEIGYSPIQPRVLLQVKELEERVGPK